MFFYDGFGELGLGGLVMAFFIGEVDAHGVYGGGYGDGGWLVWLGLWGDGDGLLGAG